MPVTDQTEAILAVAEKRFEMIPRPVENGPTNEGWVFVIRDVTREREIQQI